MNYREMWIEMRNTYKDRLKSLEGEGKKGSNAWITAKRFVDVMEGFELSQKDKVGKVADISINDLRAMAEDL